MSVYRDQITTFEVLEQKWAARMAEWDTRMAALEEKGRQQRALIVELCNQCGRDDLANMLLWLD